MNLTFNDWAEYSPLFETVLDEEVLSYEQSLGISRADMPQIEGKYVHDFISYLKKLNINVSKEPVGVEVLKPTQREYNPAKVNNLKSAPLSILKLPIIKSNDNYIIDGHHRYSAYLAVEPKGEMNCICVDVSVNELLSHAHKFPKSFTKNIE